MTIYHLLFVVSIPLYATMQADPHSYAQLREERISFLEKLDPKKTSITCAIASPLLLLVGCGTGFIGAIASAGRPGGRTPPLHPLLFVGLGNIAASIGVGILGYKVYKYHDRTTLDREIQSLRSKLYWKEARRKRLFGERRHSCWPRPQQIPDSQ